SLFRPDDFPKLTSSLTTFGYPSASVPVGLPITSYGSFQTSSVPSNPFSSGFSFEQFSSLPSVAPSGLWPSELSASRSDSVSDTAQFVSSAGSPFEFPTSSLTTATSITPDPSKWGVGISSALPLDTQKKRKNEDKIKTGDEGFTSGMPI